ncbi:hypothetical protein KKH27_02805 [bacterium]|nr:hypothetical protein [bacterium]MBU1985085.1 hypothetical protein [bacterium]
MEGYWCQFIAPVSGPEEALNWLEQKLSEYDESDRTECGQSHELPCRIERNGGQPGQLKLIGDGDGNIDAIVNAICEMQKKYHLTEPWAITWAETCPDEGLYGGGAVVCFRGQSTTMCTSNWVAETIQKLRGSDQ